MPREAYYDYERIAYLRGKNVPWGEIVDEVGAPSKNSLRSGFYRWLDTEGKHERQALREQAIKQPELVTEPSQRPKKPEPYRPPPAFAHEMSKALVLTSRPDNTFVFGVAGDKHYGSKYHRDDVCADLFKRFNDRGVDVVFDTGNWIEGDARFNKYDIDVSGLDAQCRYMAKHHPKSNAPIYAVWGDDHEGWYAQREGIDVGRYAESIMRDAGHDWTDLGFMEAHIVLENANTGAQALLSVMHPGGGSAYAISYRPQKIIEAMSGGEKPAAVFMGHYHKLDAGNIRNVWTLQTGACQDQTPFLRKRSIEVHVGGALVEFEQDPETGALIGYGPKLIRYFNKGWDNNRWSKTGPVNRIPMSP